MRRTGLLAMILVVCCACGAGPSDRPDVAVVRGGASNTPLVDAEGSAAPAPGLPAPTKDLDWRDCTATTLGSRGLGSGPKGLVLECAEYAAPIDASGTIHGSFPVGAMRARLPQTPTDVAPLVLTSGSDRASTDTLAALAAGPYASLLSNRPLVAVDRRGIGTSVAIDCISGADRRSLADLGQFTPMGVHGPDRVAAIGREATLACTDYLQPQALAFDAMHAADDLEQLRKDWGVDTLGLLGTGNGATVALAFAAKYPDRVGRMILDSPTATNADAETITENRVRGAEAAVDTFARACAALHCALGPDPRGAIVDLHRRAQAGELAPLSSNALLTAISGFLGSARGDLQARIPELADTLSKAAAGDVLPLLSLVGASESTYSSDGQFVSRCSDGQQWPAPSRVRELTSTWAQRYPLFGADSALGLMVCSSWPTMSPPALPTHLDVPVFVLSGAADPLVGNAGLSSVTGTVTAAGARWAAMTWLGSGHPASAHSTCVQGRIVHYADSGELPPDGSLCPA